MNRQEIKLHIESTLGIRPSRNLQKGEEYEANGKTFYLKRADKSPLVVHPHLTGDLHTNPLPGITPERRLYHSSNLRKFPRCLPQEAEPCGCDVAVLDVEALDSLLLRIGAVQAPEPDETTAFTDIEAAAPQLAELPQTEREAVIAARIGQGRFRTALMLAWSNQCAVTRIGIERLLRASHIKPWRNSDNGDRLDAENGLLLVATLDAAFDAGLISFADDGLMLFSPRLGPDPCAVLSVPAGCRLTRSPSSQQRAFLHHHRDHVFPHGPPRGKPPGA